MNYLDSSPGERLAGPAFTESLELVQEVHKGAPGQEHLLEAAKAPAAKAPAKAGACFPAHRLSFLKPVSAQPVILFPLLRVAQHFIRLIHVLKLCRCVRIVLRGVGTARGWKFIGERWCLPVACTLPPLPSAMLSNQPRWSIARKPPVLAATCGKLCKHE